MPWYLREAAIVALKIGEQKIYENFTENIRKRLVFLAKVGYNKKEYDHVSWQRRRDDAIYHSK